MVIWQINVLMGSICIDYGWSELPDCHRKNGANLLFWNILFECTLGGNKAKNESRTGFYIFNFISILSQNYYLGSHMISVIHPCSYFNHFLFLALKDPSKSSKFDPLGIFQSSLLPKIHKLSDSEQHDFISH